MNAAAMTTGSLIYVVIEGPRDSKAFRQRGIRLGYFVAPQFMPIRQARDLVVKLLGERTSDICDSDPDCFSWNDMKRICRNTLIVAGFQPVTNPHVSRFDIKPIPRITR